MIKLLIFYLGSKLVFPSIRCVTLDLSKNSLMWLISDSGKVFFIKEERCGIAEGLQTVKLQRSKNGGRMTKFHGTCHPGKVNTHGCTGGTCMCVFVCVHERNRKRGVSFQTVT